MLNKTVWHIFKNTGSIEAYLYLKAYDENKNALERKHQKDVLEIKEITII